MYEKGNFAINYSDGSALSKKVTLQSIAVTAVPCLNNCTCYHRQDLGVNVYNCSQGNGFPTNVPNNTDCLLCSNSHIQNIPENIQYVENITNIDISNNDLHDIPELTLSTMNKLKTLDISNNLFLSLPKGLQHSNRLESIYIAGNPINCNCDMLWLINWTNKLLPDGTRIVRHYEKVKCSYIQKQSFELTAVEMGCFPKELTSWQIAILGIGGGIIILIVIGVIVVAKRWNEVKWFLFFHFNIRDKRDADVNTLEGMKLDAMVSYRYSGTSYLFY